jgi:hypothetical protein
VLLAGAWAGGGFATADAAVAGRPPRAAVEKAYPTTADGEIPVGDSLVVNGQPMQLSLFVTEDPIAKVVEFYRSAFAARGLVPLAQSDDQLGHVSVFDPEDGYQRAITALPQPDGRTLVLVGVTNPRKPPRFTRAHAGMPFPVPPEQRGFLGYESKDGSTRAQNGQFAWSKSAPEALEWYRQKLAAEGYVESKDQTAGSVAMFVRRDAQVTVATQALGDKSGSMVFVNRVEGGER